MDAVSSAKMQCLMSGGQQRELGEISGDQSTPIGVESATKPSLGHQVTACTKTIMYGVYTEIF